VIQGAGGQLVWWWGWNQSGSGSWGSDGWGVVTGVVVVRRPQLGVAVADGVTTIEVAGLKRPWLGQRRGRCSSGLRFRQYGARAGWPTCG